MIDAATFQSLRPHLFSVAYRMLGSAAEAEDVGPLPDDGTRLLVEINGEPALVVRRGDRLDSVFVFSTDAERIHAINVVRNPEKLAWLASHGIGAAGLDLRAD